MHGHLLNMFQRLLATRTLRPLCGASGGGRWGGWGGGQLVDRVQVVGVADVHPPLSIFCSFTY